MARAGDPSRGSVSTNGSSDWREACRRGVPLGLVLGFHGLMLLALLHLNDWRRSSTRPPGEYKTALRLRLIAARRPTAAKTTPPPAPIHRLARAPRVAHAAVAAAPTPRAEAPMTMQMPTQRQNAAVTPALASSVYQPYHPGGFRQALQNAQNGSPVRLPGSDATIVAGIRLTPRHSVKKTVERVLQSLRCTDEQVSMQHHFGQFGTQRQIDRRLEADGCGPHRENPVGDAATDRADQQVIQGP